MVQELFLESKMGCLGDFMILSAILDYELSLRYDIGA